MANYKEQYPNLYHINSSLAKTKELSEHNKEVLDEYFDRWRSRTDSASNSGFASRWSTIAPHIDFKIDEASRDDWRQVYKNLSRGEITKSNSDEKYAASTQKKFHKAFSTFYNNFIDQHGEGYNKELNGAAVVAGLNDLLDEEGENKVKKETKPSASQVKEAASNLDTLRNRALLIFGWSVGARAGEIFRTQHKPQSLLWEDIRFNNDDTMTVHLRINRKKSNKNTRRRVEVVVGKPLMKKLYDEMNPDKKDPVFKAERPKLKCPNCGSRVRRAADTQDEMDTSYNREYECKECGEINQRNRLDEVEKSITGSRVNDIIAKGVNREDIRNIDKTSHNFFRSARALQKVAMNWNDNSINGFFGWEVNSSAKKRYVEALKVSQKKDLKQEHPELDVNVEGRFHDESLKPVKCSKCGKLNSRLWDFCEDCDHELTYQGMIIKQEREGSVKNEIKHDTKDEMIEYLQDRADIDDEELEEAMTERLDQQLKEKGVI